MRQTIQKYRTNTLTPDETMRLRERISTYTDEQIGEAIYEDWQDFEPEHSLFNSDAEARVKERLNEIITPEPKRRMATGIMRMIGRVAAVLIVGLLGYSTYYFYAKSNQMESQQFVVSTDVGKRADVTLPDGSTVELNGGSSICYNVADFSGDYRKIKFNGEAYFNITSMPHKPFTIETRDIEVLVKGTTFNLLAREDNDKAVLSLIEGNVRLTSLKSNNSVDMHADEKAVVDYLTGNIKVESIKPNDNVTAWRLLRLTFVNATYDEVEKQLRLYYGEKLPKLRHDEYTERFTGVIPLDNLTVAMDILNTTFGEK